MTHVPVVFALTENPRLTVYQDAHLKPRRSTGTPEWFSGGFAPDHLIAGLQRPAHCPPETTRSARSRPTDLVLGKSEVCVVDPFWLGRCIPATG